MSSPQNNREEFLSFYRKLEKLKRTRKILRPFLYKQLDRLEDGDSNDFEIAKKSIQFYVYAGREINKMFNFFKEKLSLLKGAITETDVPSRVQLLKTVYADLLHLRKITDELYEIYKFNITDLESSLKRYDYRRVMALLSMPEEEFPEHDFGEEMEMSFESCSREGLEEKDEYESINIAVGYLLHPEFQRKEAYMSKIFKRCMKDFPVDGTDHCDKIPALFMKAFKQHRSFKSREEEHEAAVLDYNIRIKSYHQVKKRVPQYRCVCPNCDNINARILLITKIKERLKYQLYRNDDLPLPLEPQEDIDEHFNMFKNPYVNSNRSSEAESCCVASTSQESGLEDVSIGNDAVEAPACEVDVPRVESESDEDEAVIVRKRKRKFNSTLNFESDSRSQSPEDSPSLHTRSASRGGQEKKQRLEKSHKYSLRSVSLSTNKTPLFANSTLFCTDDLDDNSDDESPPEVKARIHRESNKKQATSASTSMGHQNQSSKCRLKNSMDSTGSLTSLSESVQVQQKEKAVPILAPSTSVSAPTQHKNRTDLLPTLAPSLAAPAHQKDNALPHIGSSASVSTTTQQNRKSIVSKNLPTSTWVPIELLDKSVPSTGPSTSKLSLKQHKDNTGSSDRTYTSTSLPTQEKNKANTSGKSHISTAVPSQPETSLSIRNNIVGSPTKTSVATSVQAEQREKTGSLKAPTAFSISSQSKEKIDIQSREVVGAGQHGRDESKGTSENHRQKPRYTPCYSLVADFQRERECQPKKNVAARAALSCSEDKLSSLLSFKIPRKARVPSEHPSSNALPAFDAEKQKEKPTLSVPPTHAGPKKPSEIQKDSNDILGVIFNNIEAPPSINEISIRSTCPPPETTGTVVLPERVISLEKGGTKPQKKPRSGEKLTDPRRRPQNQEHGHNSAIFPSIPLIDRPENTNASSVRNQVPNVLGSIQQLSTLSNSHVPQQATNRLNTGALCNIPKVLEQHIHRNAQVPHDTQMRNTESQRESINLSSTENSTLLSLRHQIEGQEVNCDVQSNIESNSTNQLQKPVEASSNKQTVVASIEEFNEMPVLIPETLAPESNEMLRPPAAENQSTRLGVERNTMLQALLNKAGNIPQNQSVPPANIIQSQSVPPANIIQNQYIKSENDDQDQSVQNNNRSQNSFPQSSSNRNTEKGQLLLTGAKKRKQTKTPTLPHLMLRDVLENPLQVARAVNNIQVKLENTSQDQENHQVTVKTEVNITVEPAREQPLFNQQSVKRECHSPVVASYVPTNPVYVPCPPMPPANMNYQQGRMPVNNSTTFYQQMNQRQVHTSQPMYVQHNRADISQSNYGFNYNVPAQPTTSMHSVQNGFNPYLNYNQRFAPNINQANSSQYVPTSYTNGGASYMMGNHNYRNPNVSLANSNNTSVNSHFPSMNPNHAPSNRVSMSSNHVSMNPNHASMNPNHASMNPNHASMNPNHASMNPHPPHMNSNHASMSPNLPPMNSNLPSMNSNFPSRNSNLSSTNSNRMMMPFRQNFPDNTQNSPAAVQSSSIYPANQSGTYKNLHAFHPGDQNLKCIFCGLPGDSFKCNRYPDELSKFQILKKNSLCTICFKPEHFDVYGNPIECEYSRQPCKYCKFLGHNSVICIYRLLPSKNAQA